MIRGEIAKNLDHDPDFKWRGENVTRIENLSDIVFALALSMLVAGSGTPATFADLKWFLLSIIPVAAGFSVLLGVWHSHFTFFRRYGLNDGRILFLNAVLIFVILYMAYPLRFAFDSFFAFILSIFGRFEMMHSLGVSNFETSGVIIGYFGVAYAATFFLLGLMYRHALKKSDILSLTEHEIVTTKREIFTRFGLCILALFVAAMAYFTPLNGFAGMLLFLTSVPYLMANKRYPVPKTE